MRVLGQGIPRDEPELERLVGRCTTLFTERKAAVMFNRADSAANEVRSLLAGQSISFDNGSGELHRIGRGMLTRLLDIAQIELARTQGDCNNWEDRQLGELALVPSGGREGGQIAILVDELLKKKVRVLCLKEKITLNGRADMQTKVMVTMFSLFAEIERDLFSERTREGLARTRSEDKLLGRPKGSLGRAN